MALSDDPGGARRDGYEARHFGADAGAHHQPWERCPCGCEAAGADEASLPRRNLRGYEAMLVIEFRAVAP